jgi:hypothetical protein
MFSEKILCALFGHSVSNALQKQCECGAKVFAGNGAITRIRHVVRCFFSGHQYIYVDTRNAHDEFACIKCGHPLLFETGYHPYPKTARFIKRVRYLCNLFGHSVHRVATRRDFFEYACDCGHSFLKEHATTGKIKHPPICLFAGHFVRFVRCTNGQNEFVCLHCGHTFLFSRRHVA